ncbi:DNA glycosylase [Cryphonectria parasitica EP155]|uniref:DNA glycosylase n=1 Tax=Cryphonectria parasitica (strain ATCC 38755 / EP155) TaxID=660469 RepID=A0A9P5CNR8_CRYP1|nr:DNA glycosylase [Cryphonectria parasitica EP155]KAF3764612.1 DNA glycosylase [Cryphonectria parasitica EP155]
MAEEAPDSEAHGRASSPLSSFRGRLDMDAFKFETGESPQEISTAVRRSKRLSSSITMSLTAATTFPAAQPGATKNGKKRKADALADATPLGGNTFPTLPDGSTETASSTPPAPSATKKKRNRPKAGYAPPSVYAHLPYLPDALAPNLLVLFCGLNPGVRTAQTGHAYNHPSNRFWKLMYSSGVLPVPCTAEEDRTLPERFSLGLTNIVARPSRNGAELSKAEMDQGVSILEDKVRRWRPEVVCVVGKSIWESVWRVRHGGRSIKKDEFRYGWQDEGENMGVGDVTADEKMDGVVYQDDWNGARVFVATSTSGLAATLRPEEKEKIWRELGAWVEQRRAERDAPP